ncbi:MAG: hypothetical protein KF802_02535 [Bdellovibrionaceae bacterium]|nr:hypothetical protein [Pseudobdellovibrionaceae bacterium]
MKIDFCIVCGKDLTKHQGVGPVCKAVVGTGPNEYLAKRAKQEFVKARMESRGTGVIINENFEHSDLFCWINQPVPTTDQLLLVRKLNRYFYKAVFYSATSQEQVALIQDLYEEDKLTEES